MASEVLGVHIEKKNDGVLQAIKYVRGKLELLDQRHLPHVSEYIDIPTAEAAWHAIKDMVVRGAPAIAIAAALALAAELVSSPPETPDAKSTAGYVVERLQYLVSSRPTAVNLGEAAKQLSEITRTAADQPEASAQSVIDAYVVSAEQMLVDDVAANRAIGANGAEAIVKAAAKKEKLRVMTHCNTGSLATAAYGTALGVIRSLHAAGKLEIAIATETRPYNQGSRLTAYELVYEKIPAILVADSAAAAFGATRGVDAIVVGADRIAANGDTANKIGTYSVAIGAKYHGVPFFVAAPVTSIDLDIHSGAEIHIEQRDPKELTHANGGRGDPIAPAGIDVWNPSFDVTPADLIAGIITEKGVIYKADGATEFDIPAFLARVAPAPPAQNPQTLATEAGDVKPLFVGFNPETLVDYIATKTPDLATRLGGKPTDWKVREVGDGNLNLVFIVEGPQWTCVLKQSLPYVRCVGESWPLTVDRSWFEALALKEEGRLVPQHVPEVYHVDRSRALFVMRYLEPPHIILRKGLIAGHVYPLLADHVSTFLARTLFSTSLLALDTAQHKAAVAKFVVNIELCRLTEQVIFTEPYAEAANNHWTSPQLDAEAAALRSDVPLKVAITALKKKFTEQAEALVHGDLHTGSIMVTDTSTQMIDPEFAFYGPMGFDIGAFLANLILAYYSQDGHATTPGARNDCKYWIAKTIIETWALFAEKFVDLWSKFVSLESPGDLTPTLLFGTGDRTLAEYQKAFLGDLFQDSLGFAGAKIVRRIVGIAHVEDLESIADPDVRASCEKKALAFGKVLLKERSQFESIQQLVKALEPKG